MFYLNLLAAQSSLDPPRTYTYAILNRSRKGHNKRPTVMKFSGILLIVSTATLWLQVASSQQSTATCVELTGIVSGGGEGMLDLDVIRENFQYEIGNLSIPVVGIASVCEKTGLETPISMRNLLGQSANLTRQKYFYV